MPRELREQLHCAMNVSARELKKSDSCEMKVNGVGRKRSDAVWCGAVRFVNMKRSACCSWQGE